MKSARILCIVALFITPRVAGAQADTPLPFCANPELDPAPTGSLDAVLPPRDDAARRSDFLRFRTELLEIVRRRDLSALLERVSADITVAFDGSGGRNDFVKYRARHRGFWTEFERILAGGGTFTRRDTFAAPYVFAAWPEGVDPIGCMAVIGKGVRLRELPSTSSPSLASIDYAIVRWISDERTDRRWVHVGLANGRVGYIDSAFVRSPVGLRAIFERRKERWWLTGYVDGD